MKNPKAVSKQIAERHNQEVKHSVRGVTAIGEEVIRRVEDAVEDAYERTAKKAWNSIGNFSKSPTQMRLLTLNSFMNLYQ